MPDTGNEMNDPDHHLTRYPGGEAHYSFRMYAAYDRLICCAIAHPRVIECVFSKVDTADPFDPAWHLKIRLGPLRSTKEIDEIGKAISDEIFDQLSLAFNIRVDQIRMTGHPLTPIPGGGGIADFISPMPTLTMEGRGGCRQLLADDIQELQDILAKSVLLPNTTVLVALYRSALGTDDPVAKFLILYLILYEVSGNDSQKKVDALIRKYAPSTATDQRPWVDKNGLQQLAKETIYTRLRNEITHRIAVTPEGYREAIISNLDTFQTIVHQALRT